VENLDMGIPLQLQSLGYVAHEDFMALTHSCMVYQQWHLTWHHACLTLKALILSKWPPPIPGNSRKWHRISGWTCNN